jgi:hypothetical protein
MIGKGLYDCSQAVEPPSSAAVLFTSALGARTSSPDIMPPLGMAASAVLYLQVLPGLTDTGRLLWALYGHRVSSENRLDSFFLFIPGRGIG